MNFTRLKKLLTRLSRLSFILACITIAVTFFASHFIEGIQPDKYPVSGTITTIVTLIFISAICRVVRDLMPESMPNKQNQG